MIISPTEYRTPREVSAHAIKAENSVFLYTAVVLNGTMSVTLSPYALVMQRREYNELRTCIQNLQGRNQL